MSGGVGQGVLPPVVVLPLACLAVVVITAHLVAMSGARDMPLSRRRIRTASGMVMLLTTLVLAYAFAYAPASEPRRFTIAWAGSIMLLAVVLGLGGLDAINNVRLARLQKRRMRREGRRLGRELAEALAERAEKSGAGRDGQPTLRLRGGDGGRDPEA